MDFILPFYSSHVSFFYSVCCIICSSSYSCVNSSLLRNDQATWRRLVYYIEIVWNYIRCIYRNRSVIWTQTNWVLWNDWIRMRCSVLMSMLCNYCMRVYWNSWIRIIMMILVRILSFYTPWDIFIRKTFLVNVYLNMFIWMKLFVMIPMYSSIMTITIKTQ